MFLPIQESHDEQNLFLPLITQSHRLLLAVSRMAFGKTTENFINTQQNNKPTPSPTVAPVKKPGQVKGLKLKAGKKKVTVTYKKVSGATSYKVTYSTSKKSIKAKSSASSVKTVPVNPQRSTALSA